jgi:membrane-bound ClpP family serine protease
LFLTNGWVITLLILIVAFIVFAVLRSIDAHHRQPTTGKEDLRGKTAIVRETLDPEGTVFREGELWTAISNSGKIESGEEVIISKVRGLKLWVTNKAKE